jgi:hypothetical protein
MDFAALALSLITACRLQRPISHVSGGKIREEEKDQTDNPVADEAILGRIEEACISLGWRR